MTQTDDGPNWLLIVNRVVGTALWFPVLFIYGLSNLIAPMSGVLLLWVVGAIWLGIATRWWHARSLWYAASPVLALGSWMLIGNLGDALLGWTA